MRAEITPDELFAAPKIHRFVAGEKYASSFGDQWQRFPKTQLDSFSKLTLTRDRLRRCLGEHLWSQLSGKTVLEVGAGARRFTEVLLNQGAKVVSVDLSEAVVVNAANFAPNGQHAVVQADVMNMPFRRGSFDIVICLGVIQHTPNPEQTIAKLAAQVGPNGWLVIDHYTFTKSWISLRLLYRHVFKRMAHFKAIRLIEKLAKIFLPLHRAVRNSKPLSVLLNRISPMVTYYSAYPNLDDAAQTDWAILDTVDTLTDWFKHYRTKPQIDTCLNNLGFLDIYSQYAGNGVEARARRAADHC